MNSSQAMKEQGLKYFSSLTSVQKDKTCYFILKSRLKITELPEELSKSIINNMGIDDLIKIQTETKEHLKNQKCFKHNGVYYPLNIKEILKK